MKIFAETEQLILREMLPEDVDGMFELDSNPEVLKYLNMQALTDREQSAEFIRFIRQQYIDNGIGRWAVIEKSGGEFAGWAGLKYIREPMNGRANFYDIGYRLLPGYWGRGFASEAAAASLDYAFNTMKIDEVIGIAHVDNAASNRVLQKSGLQYVNTFRLKGIDCNWYEISGNEFISSGNK